MKTNKKIGSTALELSERIDQISDDLFFHPHPVLEKIWIETPAVCELLGVSPRTLFTYRQKGMIECRFTDGVNWYPAGQVETLMRYVRLKSL